MADKSKAKANAVTVSSSDEATQAVKVYLASFGQPKKAGRPKASIKDQIPEITKGITDPLKKLAAIKAAREALVPEPDPEAEFIKYAKGYAKANGYTREDFALLGVPARVLGAAFGGGTAKVAGEKRVRMTKADKEAQTARIVAHIAGLKSGTEFKTAEISEVLKVKGTDALEVINAILKAGGPIVKEGEKKNTKYVRL